MSAADLKPGDKFEAIYPFVRCEYDGVDEFGPFTIVSWKPGVEYEEYGPEGEADAVAHGEGKVLLEVVDVHKPGRYPTRVFFTRQWLRPDCKVFGKTCLRITTLDAFRRLTRGWRHEQYEVRP